MDVVSHGVWDCPLYGIFLPRVFSVERRIAPIGSFPFPDHSLPHFSKSLPIRVPVPLATPAVRLNHSNPLTIVPTATSSITPRRYRHSSLTTLGSSIQLFFIALASTYSICLRIDAFCKIQLHLWRLPSQVKWTERKKESMNLIALGSPLAKATYCSNS